jgi:hypothetical protein
MNNFVLFQKVNIDNDNQPPSQQQISAFEDYFKNQIFVPKSSLLSKDYNNQVGHLNLHELLNELSDQTLAYSIVINGHQIASHGIMNNDTVRLEKSYLISSDIECDIVLQIRSDSVYAYSTDIKMKAQIQNFVMASVVAFFSSMFVIYYLLNRDKKLKNQIEQLDTKLRTIIQHNNSIRLLREKEKAYILKCYQYSKIIKGSHLQNLCGASLDSNEYLPLPLCFDEETQYGANKLSLKNVITELKDYFDGYVAYYSLQMTLEITYSSDEIIVPFDEEIFSQIITSLFYNILYFNKNLEKLKHIRLSFKDNTITFASDGFLLDHNLAIRYSEKIFNDTGNLYLLNLGQVFSLIKKYKSNYSVAVKDMETIIEIRLANTFEAINNIDVANNENKIINIHKFQKGSLK